CTRYGGDRGDWYFDYW
nr:immunoglobulin heavy chain junction region [Macaca mulatta]MOX62701.1 immunoglobulin heavy chain junction region [Macaca mulatta]MOX64534.1 immunoglobulin heavy chain junction region [Macaca mulatta]MOX66140.1 immunoglobulin heavy chain junction region [Macaca mulatta]MOX67754.1 immunoglobulin heavy chain junction region [Macaca mulatta]